MCKEEAMTGNTGKFYKKWAISVHLPVGGLRHFSLHIRACSERVRVHLHLSVSSGNDTPVLPVVFGVKHGGI